MYLLSQGDLRRLRNNLCKSALIRDLKVSRWPRPRTSEPMTSGCPPRVSHCQCIWKGDFWVISWVGIWLEMLIFSIKMIGYACLNIIQLLKWRNIILIFFDLEIFLRFSYYSCAAHYWIFWWGNRTSQPLILTSCIYPPVILSLSVHKRRDIKEILVSGMITKRSETGEKINAPHRELSESLLG